MDRVFAMLARIGEDRLASALPPGWRLVGVRVSKAPGQPIVVVIRLDLVAAGSKFGGIDVGWDDRNAAPDERLDSELLKLVRVQAVRLSPGA